jgi:tetratricopeptide (TPR) repeat protein
VSDHYFVSYSRLDGEDFALRLADTLAAGPPPYHAWVDRREMQPGRQDWDDQLVQAIQTCRGLLFVMSADSVRVGSGCKDEWVSALKYKKPVIPVRLHDDADLPFRLSSRQFIDFSQGFETGLAELRDFLRWTATPEGELQELGNRLADAERELLRAAPGQRARIEQEIEELQARIAGQERTVGDPQAAREQTEARIEAAIERERQLERPVTPPARAKFVNPPPMTAPGHFQDRHVETKMIGDFLRADGPRLMSVIGRGGVGKTAMVCRLLKGLEAGRLPDDGGELAVDGIVYLSPIGAHAVSFPNLLADLCRLLPSETAESLLARYRDPQETPAALMQGLLEAFPGGRSVVLLDNFEGLLDDETFEIKERDLDEGLRALLSAPAHGVKVLITSRAAPRSLVLVQPGAQARLELDAGLESPYAEEILRAMDPSGDLGLRDAPAGLLAQARERTRGFPRALEALAAILAADRDTTLPELLADAGPMPENVVAALVGEAFNRLDPLAQQVMQALAIFTVPVPPVAVDYLLQPYQPAMDSAAVLSRLVNMQFARRDAGRYYLHQVDCDYALERVPPGQAADREAEPAPFTQHALRARGADYFQETRTPRETWCSLEDLAPQLAELELRQQAADYDTAAQVLLDIDYDYLSLWGHCRLVIERHQRLQGHLTNPSTDAACKTNLGIAFSLAGETRRAIELYEQALAIARETGDRQGEGIHLGNLGLCHADLGETRRAIDLHGQALAIAREVGDRQGEGIDLGNLGIRYADLGETARAIDLHEQALAIARETGNRQGEGLQLTNLGLRYADLGETARAIDFHEQALAIAHEIGHRQGEAASLTGLGSSYAHMGETRRAIDLYEQALAIAREVGDRQAEGIDLGSLGNCYADLGETRRAIDLYEQALAIAREVGDRQSEGRALTGLGNGHFVLGETARAIDLSEQALAIDRETGDRRPAGRGNRSGQPRQLLRRPG